MFRYFQRYRREMPVFKDFATSLSRKETELIRRVFYAREQIEQVLGWLQSDSVVVKVKLSFDCGLRITVELRSQGHE